MTTTLEHPPAATAAAPGRPAALMVRMMFLNGALLLINALVWIMNIARGEWINTDYGAFYTGWTLAADGHGRQLYDFALQKSTQLHLLGNRQYPGGLLAFVNPPHVALFGAPVARLSMYHGYLAVAAANVALSLLLTLCLFRVAGRGRAGTATALAVIASASLAVALTMGAFSVVVALGMLGFIAALKRADRFSPLLLLAFVGLSCKPQYVMLPLLALLAARRWRNAASAVVALGAVFAVGALAYGPHIWLDYARRLQQYGGGRNSFGVNPQTMWNARGMLTLLLGTGSGPLVQSLSSCLLGAAAVFVAVTWWRAVPQGSSNTSIAPGLVAATVLLSVITSLHAHPQDGVVAAVALAAIAGVAVLRPRAAAPRIGHGLTFGQLGLAFPVLSSVAVTMLRTPIGRLPFLAFAAVALLAWRSTRANA